MDKRALGRLALKLAEEKKTMLIAVNGPRGPWASPVYYVFFKSAFWFFSSPESIHISHGERAGVSIFNEGSGDWKDIRGLQMQGSIRPAGTKALAAFFAYKKKFPFAAKVLNLIFKMRKNRPYFFVFYPDHILYSDNSLGFAFKGELDFN